MPTILETFKVASDGPTHVNYVLPTVTESFKAGTALSASQAQVLSEQFAAVSTASAEAYLRVFETFQVSTGATGSERRTVSETEQFSAGDSAFGRSGAQATASEAFVALDILSTVVVRVRASESFSTQDAATTASDSQAVAQETFKALDSASGAESRQETVTEQFAAVSRTVVAPKAFAAEQFVASSATTAAVHGSVTVREIFAASAAATPTAQIRVTGREQFFVASQAKGRADFELASIDQPVPFGATSVWTADTRSWGMSRYVGLPVREFVRNQFGVGPEGVFAASTAPVVSFFETGDVTLAVEGDRRDLRKKRIHYIYGYAEQTDPLQVRVYADHNGERRTELYEQEARASEQTRAVRCQVGRGFATNYLRLRMGGAVTFDMAGLEAELSATSRRI